MVLFLAVTAKQQAVEQKIKNYLTKWRQIQQKIPLPEMTELLITPQLPEYPKFAHDVFMLLLDGKLRSRTETLKFLKPFAPPPPPPPPALHAVDAPPKPLLKLPQPPPQPRTRQKPRPSPAPKGKKGRPQPPRAPPVARTAAGSQAVTQPKVQSAPRTGTKHSQPSKPAPKPAKKAKKLRVETASLGSKGRGESSPSKQKAEAISGNRPIMAVYAPFGFHRGVRTFPDCAPLRPTRRWPRRWIRRSAWYEWRSHAAAISLGNALGILWQRS